MTCIRMTLHNFVVERIILLKGKIKKGNGLLRLKYKGRELSFVWTEWVAYPLEEIFIKGTYSRLNVKGKNVIDIGASVADSPIYFALNGAEHVYGYEPDKERYKMALRNIELNNMGKKITLFNKPYDGTQDGNAVIKIDCEGCEYGLFERLGDKLGRFEEVIMEYHNGSKPIREMLTNSGFNVEIMPLKGSTGYIYAYKKASVVER